MARRPMTIAEKILALHAGKKEVTPGEIVDAKIDIALGNDITAPLAIEELRKVGAKRVFNRRRVVLVMDHFTPNKDIKSATQCKLVREFAREFGIVNYFEGGSVGIEHALLPEKGLVVSGDVVVGADSHTCTYGGLGAFGTGVGSTDLAFAMITGKLWFRVPQSVKFIFRGRLKRWVSGKDLILHTIGDIGVDGANYKAMEFAGDTIRRLSMDSRLALCNMAIEAGAKAGLIEPDETTERYVLERAQRRPRFLRSDPDAEYVEVREYDATKIEPLVALPHLPENTKPVREVAGIPIDQVVIGSCTNGRIEDLAITARILRGNRVSPNTRLIIIPATPRIYETALRRGYIRIFLSAGAVISPPTCGPCLGGHMGILAEGERAVATTNRNFVGRMGHPRSEVYLANPAVAAATAVKGRIAHPDEVVKH